MRDGTSEEKGLSMVLTHRCIYGALAQLSKLCQLLAVTTKGTATSFAADSARLHVDDR